jgi:hypothetical protein
VSAVATAEQAPLDAAPEAPPVFEHGGTLEDRVLKAWEDLVLEGCGPCLVCGAAVETGSACHDCGSLLS